MSFWPEVDEEQTIENVDGLLKDYPHYRMRAKREAGLLRSPSMDGMPRADSYDNRVEEEYVSHVEAQQVELNCRYAIESIEDNELRTILHDKYMRGDTNEAIMIKLNNMPKETYRRRWHNACLTFAEIYGIQELQVFKTAKT